MCETKKNTTGIFKMINIGKSTVHILFFLCFIILFFTSFFSRAQDNICFGGSENDNGVFVIETSDGGYAILGSTNSFGAGGSDIYLIKIDSEFDLDWQKTFGGPNGDGGSSIQQTADGGYIIVGSTNSFGAGGSDIYLIKTDEDGNEEWSNTYGSTTDDVGSYVQQTADGGYIMAGNRVVNSSYDPYLVKANSSGGEEWSKVFTSSFRDWFYVAKQTPDGGYVAGGGSESFTGEREVLFLKTDAQGYQQWIKIWNETGGSECHYFDFTNTGEYIITGWTLDGIYLAKLNTAGDIIWSNSVGGTHGHGVQETSDNGFIVTGWTGSYPYWDAYLTKTDNLGQVVWSETYGGNGSESGRSVLQTIDNGYLLVGDTDSYGEGKSDVYLVKTDENGVVSSKTTIDSDISCNIYPNPSSSIVLIQFSLSLPEEASIKILDEKGKLIKILANNKHFEAGTNEIVWNSNDINNRQITAGLYFCIIETLRGSKTTKIVLSE
jgi:type IX secretion system substrate protein